MSAYTPGPWSIWNFSDDPRHVAVGPDVGGLAIADVVACNAHGCYTAETESRGQANARLIAAAPDLLAALREIVAAVESGDIDGYSPSGDWFREARAAIAKARGENA